MSIGNLAAPREYLWPFHLDKDQTRPLARLQEAARAAGDGPSADAGNKAASAVPQVGTVGLSLTDKIQLRIDKREGCRKQAEAQGLGMVDRVKFVQQCVQQ